MTKLLLIAINLFSMTHKDTIQVVTPDDGTVTGYKINPYTNSWNMTAVKPGGSVINRGIWNDEVSIYTDNSGREILRRKQTVEYAESTSIQEEEVYRDNLRHIYLKIYNAGKEPHTDIHYSDNKIWGKKVFRIAGLDDFEQISMPFSFELPRPVFDWHLWGILVSGFPLKENYSARFLAHESYSYFPGDFRWYILKVIGRETIDGGKWGEVDCWKVELDAEVRWILWIAVKKNVAPVQQICIYDFDGSELWWKPLKQN